MTLVEETNSPDDLDDASYRVILPRAKQTKETYSDSFKKGVSEVTGLSQATKRRGQRAMEKVHRGDGAESKKIDDSVGSLYGVLDVVEPPFNLEYLATLYAAKSPPHYAAVNAKVENVVGLGFDLVESHKTQQLMDTKKDKPQVIERMRQKLAVLKSSVFEWLESCNEDDEFDETLKKVYIDYESTGNGYFEIGRRVTGEIGYIGHIRATTMRIRAKRDGFVQVSGGKVTYFRNFGDTSANPVGDDSSPNEIIHIKKYSPISGYYGVPDVIPAIGSIAGNEFASRFNLEYFENKAVPRYIIVSKGAPLSLGSQRNIVEFFEASLKGQNHRTLYIPMPADEQDRKSSFEMKPVEAGVQDASFTNYHKANINSILMANRVPVTKVGMAEGVSLAVARDADKTFKEQTIRPSQRVLERKLNKVFKEKTDAFRFKLNELTLTDEDTQSKIDERYLRMRVIVPNEVRARWGKPGIKGGDEVVDLKPDQSKEQRAQAMDSRTRDQERSANSPDTSGEARQPQGEGRVTS